MSSITYLYETHIRELKAKQTQYMAIPITDEAKKGTIELVPKERKIWFFSPKSMVKTKWFKDCLKLVSKEKITSIAFQKFLNNVDMSEQVWLEYEQHIIDFSIDIGDKVAITICSSFEKVEEESISLHSSDSGESFSEEDDDESSEEEDESEDSFIASSDDDSDDIEDIDESGSFSEISSGTESEESSDGLDSDFLMEQLTLALKRLEGLGVKTNLCKWCGIWEELKPKKPADIIEEECSKCRDIDHSSDCTASTADSEDESSDPETESEGGEPEQASVISKKSKTVVKPVVKTVPTPVVKPVVKTVPTPVVKPVPTSVPKPVVKTIVKK